MPKSYIFSSESVGEGHPDKVADTISDAVLDACLAQDKNSRVACETYVKSNIAIVGGEITTKAKLDYVQIVRDAIREIGYVNNDDVFHADQARPLKAGELGGDVALGDPEDFLELRDGELLQPEHGQQAHPGGVGQEGDGFED